jgi:uncharacterized protein YoxC
MGVVSSLTNIFSTLGDSTKSFGEKFKTVGLGIVGLIPMLISLGTTAKASFVAIAEGAGMSSAAIAALPIGWILAAIAAVVGLIALVVKLADNFHKASAAGQLEESTKTAAALKESLTETIDRANELHEAFNKYDDAVKALEDCRKGTDEWREALEKVNDAALDILTQYPELAK